MVRRCTMLSVLILSLVSTGAQALGLGDIQLHSALNQNLNADIDLLSVEKGGIADVRVTLASPDAFARAGVERTFLLSRLRFKAERLPDGSAVLHVTTLEPVREPFLNFLIEANWPKGKLVREYTVLLDPPVTLGRKPAPVEAPKVAPDPDLPPPPKMVDTPPPVTPPPVVESKPEPQPQPEPEPEAKPEAAVVPPPAKPAPSSSAVAAEDVAWAGDTVTGDYSVVKGDTLWGIVTRSRIKGVTDKQLMMAIYHANRKAFFGNNINNLKAGEILRIPEGDDALAIEISDANNQYREHVDIWMAAKREAAPVVAEEKEAPAEQAASTEDTDAAEKDKDTTVAKEETPPAKQEDAATAKEDAAPVEQDKPVAEVAADKIEKEPIPEAELKIATARPEGEGEAGPSEGDAAKETVARLTQELVLAQEELESTKQEGGELQSRVDDLEGQISDLQRLITLRSDQLAQLQANAAETAIAEDESATPPAEVEAVAEEAPPVAAEEESVVSPVEVEATPTAEGEAPGIDVAPLTPPVESQISEIEAEPTAPPVEAEPPVSAVTPIAPPPPPVESQSPAAQAKPIAPPPARVKPEPLEEPGFIAGLLGSTSMLTIGGGILIVLLLLIWLIKRRGGGDGGNFEESILLDSSRSMNSVESTLEEVVEGPGGHTEDTSFLSDFSPSDIDALQDETGEVDPLSEADVYISYGRYQQAEDLIRQAIDKDPSRHLLQHKLFDILYALKDGDGFVKLVEESAGTAVETSDAAAWNKILSMGKTLVSDHPMFAGVEPLHGAAGQAEDGQDELDDFDLDSIAAELDAEEAAGLSSEEINLSNNVAEMDAAEETTLNIGEMAPDEEEADDVIDDLDLSGLDDDSEMLVEMSSGDDPDASILTDLSESELVSLDVDEAGEVDTKIDLARAYMDMGDPDGAKDILDEVLAEGNDSQKAEAQKLKDQIS